MRSNASISKNVCIAFKLFLVPSHICWPKAVSSSGVELSPFPSSEPEPESPVPPFPEPLDTAPIAIEPFGRLPPDEASNGTFTTYPAFAIPDIKANVSIDNICFSYVLLCLFVILIFLL